MDFVKYIEDGQEVLKRYDAADGRCYQIFQSDTVAFDAAVADPANTIVDYENTAEYTQKVLSEKSAEERKWRDQRLTNLDRYLNDLEDRGGNPAQQNLVRANRVSMRDYPQEVGFPNGVRPVEVTPTPVEYPEE